MTDRALKYNLDQLSVADQVRGCRLYDVQHDRRVVLSADYKIEGINIPRMPDMVANYAAQAAADKISVRVPGHIANLFIDKGYTIEASIPGYYGPGEPLLMMARHFTARRALASRVNFEEGYNLEIQYREGQAEPKVEGNLSIEIIDREQQEQALGFYMQHSTLVDRVDIERLLMGEPQIICISKDSQLVGVGALILEAEGRVGRIQGLIVNSDEAAALELINYLWVLAEQQGISCLYSITNSQDEIINRILPASGFGFRGKLGADVLNNGVYGDRYVWSRN